MRPLALIPFALLACLLTGFVPRTDAATITLVDDGQAKAIIITPSAQSEQAAKAASELQRYIKLMSGVELPMLPDNGKPARGMALIHVGHTGGAKQLVEDIPSGFDPKPREDAFEEEGYVIKTFDNTLVLAGNEDGPYRGTLFAVYDLLERLGCRWYFPSDFGEVVPEKKTITVGDLDVREAPDFAVRHQGLGGWVKTSREERDIHAAWMTKMRATDKGMYPAVGDGFLAGLVHPKEYFESNPEFFAMNQAGERHAHWHRAGWYYDRHTMLCLSNQDMYAEAVKNLKAAFAGEKKLGVAGELGFGISPPDGVPYCYCPECKKESLNLEFPRYVHRVTQSEEFFAFAARLAREFPDKYASTMAYSLREIYPQGVEIPQNMAVKIAPISCDVLHPNDTHLWRRRDFIRNLKAWREKTPHITLYTYNPGMLTGMWLPERLGENMAINAKIYRDIDIKGFTPEGRKAFMQTWISYYLSFKLWWDADADIDALKADFYNTFFGPDAGPHVRAWWDAHADRLLADPMQAHEDFLINHIYTPEFAASLVPHVDAARKAKMTDKQRERFDAFELIHKHFMAFTKMNAAEQAMDYKTAGEASAEMTALKQKLHDTWSYFMELTPGRKSPYFAEGKTVLFEQLHAKMNGEIGDEVFRLPLDMKFKRDPFNEGIVAGWQRPGFDHSDWDTRNTFYTWDQQEEPLDEAGHDWDGIGWYRAEFDVDKAFAGRPIKFWCGGTINQGWVWINGKYVGKSKDKLWWGHPHEFELDVTDAIKPGQKNTIAIRVLNDAEIGGLFRRGFIWAAKPGAEASGE